MNLAHPLFSVVDSNAGWEEVGTGSASGGGISDNSGASRYPSMAIAPNGTPYVAWRDDNGGNGEIYVRRWNGSSWEGVGTGSASGGGISDNSGSSAFPSVAIAPDGTPHVAWQDYSGGGDYEIYVRRWSGSTWEEVGLGSASGGGISDNSGGSYAPSVAIAPNGTPYIAWEDASGGDREVYVRRWNGSIWEEIGTGSASGGGISDNSGDSWFSSVAITPDGTPYVAWQDDSGGDNEIYVRRWNGSTWEEVGLGSASGGGISNNSGGSYAPSMAIAPGGTPYIAWEDWSGGDAEIYMRRWNGSGWEELGAGSASGGGISNNNDSSFDPSVAIASDGTPYVAWEDFSGGDGEIYVRRWNGSGWEEVGAGSATSGGISDNSGGSYNASAAIAPDGVPYVAWEDWSSEDTEIYVRRFTGGVGPTYSLSGIVIDATTNGPLSGVQISISGPSQTITTTAADGLYTFENLPAGQYWFEARKEGYDTVSTLVRIMTDTVYNPLMRLAPPSYENLAGHYAPVWYQDVDATDPDADYITNFDFDGNWDGDDNWQHQNDGYPLKAYVYYSVIETESHYFIMYADFHPRDWGGVGNESSLECTEEFIEQCPEEIKEWIIWALGGCHENDMEGALVVVRKEDGKPYGEFHLMATVFHKGFTFYSDSGDVQFFDDTHPMLYVEPKGHGVQAYDISHFVGDGVVRYVYEAGNAQVPPAFLPGTCQTVKYDMKYIKDVLWARRLDYRAPINDQQTYKRWGLFDENEVPRPIVGARPPWGWGGMEALLPIIVVNSLFQDPAHLIPRQLDGLDMGIWSYEYSYNPYLAFKVVVSLLGGLLTSNDGSTEVEMPPGITTGSIKLIHTPLVDDGSSAASSDSIQVGSASRTAMSTGDLASVSHGFELTAEFLETGLSVTSLQKPYEITFRYTDDQVEGVFEDSLALYWWDGSEWIAEPTSAVDEANNTVTGTPGHLGIFAVLGTPKATVYLPLVLRLYVTP